jgi:hypothetical protein
MKSFDDMYFVHVLLSPLQDYARRWRNCIKWPLLETQGIEAFIPAIPDTLMTSTGAK